MLEDKILGQCGKTEAQEFPASTVHRHPSSLDLVYDARNG
jgi:hypothetical protein